MTKEELVELMYQYRFTSYCISVNALDEINGRKVLDYYNQTLMIEYAKETGNVPGTFTLEDAFTYYNDKVKIDLYNYALEKELEKMQKPVDVFGVEIDFTDVFTYDNLEILNDLMNKNEGLFSCNKELATREIPKVESATTEKMIMTFLSELDPSGTMISDYLEYVRDGKIVNIEPGNTEKLAQVREKFDSQMIHIGYSTIPLTDDDQLIVTCKEGVAMDFPSVIHEFIHAEIMKYGNKVPNILAEYYSITAELLALDYAKGKTIDETDRLAIEDRRKVTSGLLLLTNQSILNFLAKKKNKEPVTMEDLEKEAEIKIKRTKSTISEQLLRTIEMIQPDYFDKDKLVDESLEKSINTCVSVDGGIIKSYPYVIGNILAIDTVKKINSGELPKSEFVHWVLNGGEKSAKEVFDVTLGTKGLIDRNSKQY